MKILIGLFLALLTGSVFAADPVPSFTPSRTSGTAPMCVSFDATATTDADTTNPFRDLVYRWSFGDVNAGTWAYGSNTAQSKNEARGPIAAHCYETAGTYRATLSVCDAAKCVTTRSAAITVTAADTTFSGTNTVCIANSTAIAGVGGCPTGASTPTGTSDFNAALDACKGSGKRCLFKRGDTFSSSSGTWVSLTGITNMIVGAYGSGALPIISKIADGSDLFRMDTTNNSVTFMDLDFVGPGTAIINTDLMLFTGEPTNVTFLRVTCRDVGACYGSTGTNTVTGLFIVDSTMTGMTGGNAVFLYVAGGAVMGNYAADPRAPGYLGCGTCAGEHLLRIQYGYKTVISNNTLARPVAAKHHITVRAKPHTAGAGTWDASTDTQYMVISNNYLDGSDSVNQILLQIGPAGDTQCHWARHVLIERNRLVATAASTSTGMYLQQTLTTVRNNVLTMANNGPAVFVLYSNDGTCSGDPAPNAVNAPPNPDDNWIGNNSIYNSATISSGTAFYPVQNCNTGKTCTNTTFVNNLAYAPNAASTTLTFPLLVGTTTGYSGSNNSTDSSGTNQIKNTSPQFASTPPSTLSTFRIDAASYGTTGGTKVAASAAAANLEDALGCRDKNNTARIGALVPASRAQCSGAGK